MKQKIYLRFQTYNKQSFESFKLQLLELSKAYDVIFSSISLPMQKKKFSLLKSPHVNKKSKDQLEVRFYNGLIILTSMSFCDVFLHQMKLCFKQDVLVKISSSIKFLKCKN